MKIAPISGPLQQNMGESPERLATVARAKAISMGQAPNQQPPAQVVQNQSAVTLEEMGAIMAPKAAEPQGQPDVSEEVAAPASEEATPEVVETPEQKAMAAQYAQLARRERQLRQRAQQQEAAIKAREAALAEKEAKLTSSAPDLSKYIPREEIKKNTLKILAEEGISYDELTQQILNQGSVDPRLEAHISRLEAKIRDLESATENTNKTYQTQQQAAYDAAIKQIRADVKNLVSSDPTFETIKATNSVSDVVDLIRQTHDKDGILLSVEEAAQQVEDYLVEEATKLAKLQKIQKRISQPAQAAKTQPAQPSQPKPSQQPQMKTLTNSISSNRPISARERAIAAFEGRQR